MARLPRFAVPGQPQHVIQRGNNREVIFVSDDDYRFYLEALQEACVKYQCDVHAYVLMTNHVHLLITPTTERVNHRKGQSQKGSITESNHRKQSQKAITESNHRKQSQHNQSMGSDSIDRLVSAMLTSITQSK